MKIAGGRRALKFHRRNDGEVLEKCQFDGLHSGLQCMINSDTSQISWMMPWTSNDKQNSWVLILTLDISARHSLTPNWMVSYQN